MQAAWIVIIALGVSGLSLCAVNGIAALACAVLVPMLLSPVIIAWSSATRAKRIFQDPPHIFNACDSGFWNSTWKLWSRDKAQRVTAA